MVCDELVREAIAMLERWREERYTTQAAWADVQRLRSAHPGRYVQLVWERERYLDKVHYDILVGRGAGVLSISYCADDDVPWPTRGIQRVEECIVARVDGEPVDIGRAMSSLDYAWHTLHIGRHLIDMSLLEQERRLREIVVEDDELEPVLEEFRAKRQLFSAAAAERWMAEHGVSHEQLDHHLREQTAQRKLRRVVTGGDAACDEHFYTHRADFERVQVARILVPARGHAESLLADLLAEPAQFMPVAQRIFLDMGGLGDVFATWQRRTLDSGLAEIIFATQPGCVVPRVLPSGEGFEIVQVLRHVPCELDDELREQIREMLFQRWLSRRREVSRVEWFWGSAETADVPSLRL